MRSGDLIWWNGKLVPWDSALVHVTSETALRGLNVFEGLRAYWRPEETSFAVIGLDAHLTRLQASARLLEIPVEHVVRRFKEAITMVLQSIRKPSDVYLRPTIYVDRGAYRAEPTEVSLGEFVSWRPEISRVDRTLRCCVSRWMRLPSQTLPSKAKIGATYTAFRMARIEAQQNGYEEAILLNSNGRVCETAGGSIFAVIDGQLVTPPLEEDVLPSITRQIVIQTICPHLNIRVQQRPLVVDNLLTAREVFIAGTLDEISQVVQIGERALDNDDSKSLTSNIQTLFRALIDGSQFGDSGWVEAVPLMEALSNEN